MTTLHITLEEGFHGQTVSIAVGALTVYQQSSLRTDLRISRAAAFDTEVAPGLAQVKVWVEPGGLPASVDVDAVITPYLGIAVDPAGAIVFRPSVSMPRYL